MNEPNTKSSGTVYLILIQVLSRGLTFIGNQAVLRYLTPADLGLAVQLEALSISVLYTSRESLRVALQRRPKLAESKEQNEHDTLNTQAAINAAYFVVLLGIALGVGFSTFYLGTASSDVKFAQDFGLSFQLYAVATIVELLSEPGFLIIQEQALFKARAFVETTAATSRCIAAVSTAWYMTKHSRPTSTLPFAIGQLTYAIVLLALYLNSARQVTGSKSVSLAPRRIAVQNALFGIIPSRLLSLAGAFYGQSIFKWLLTQGDTLVLSYFADLKSQGIFALASNYGGLASRLLFQPIEESSRTLFGRLLTVKDKSADRKQETNIDKNRKEALHHLSTIVRGYLVLIAFPCTTLLPKIFPLVIQILLGSRSSFFSPRTASLLAAYSYYLPFLALNGILDAFVTSIATKAELAEQSLAMAGVTVLYVSTAAMFMSQLSSAEVGLVYANILNMSFRILFSLWFIRAWIQHNFRGMNSMAFSDFVTACLPRKGLMVCWALVEMMVYAEESIVDQMKLSTKYTAISIAGIPVEVAEIGYIVSIAVMLVSTILIAERAFLLQTFEHLLPVRLRSLLSTDNVKKDQ